MIAQSEAANRYLTMAKTFFGTSHPLFNAFGIEVEEGKITPYPGEAGTDEVLPGTVPFPANKIKSDICRV